MLGELVIDWIFPLGLVALLATMVRMRATIIRLDEHAYHFITSGLCFLGLSVVLRLYHLSGLFQQLPFISDHISYRLLFWSACTAGFGLIVSGLASLLSEIANTRLQFTHRVAGLELIRTIERLSSVEPRVERLLLATGEQVAKVLQAPLYAVYRRNEAGTALHRCAADLPDDSRLPQVIELADADEYLDGLCASLSLAVFPVRTEQQTEALLVVGPELKLSAEDRTNIAVVCEILAHRFTAEQLALRIANDKKFLSLRTELLRQIQSFREPQRALTFLLMRLKDHYALTQASLCAIHRRNSRMTRLTVGTTGSMLTEKGLPIPSGIAERLTTVESGAALTIHPSSVDSVELGIVVPNSTTVAVWSGEATAAPLVLLMVCPSSSPVLALHDQEQLAHLFEESLVAVRRLRRLRRSRRRLGRLQRVIQHHLLRDDPASLAQALANLVRTELDVEVVRCAEIDTSPTFLATLALARPDSSTTGAGTTLRTQLPIHERVIATGRAAWYDSIGADMAISVVEASAMLTSPLGATAILPIMTGERTRGTLSVSAGAGSMRRAFTRQERQWLVLVAQLMGWALGRDRKSMPNQAWSITSDRQLRTRMKSSLSGIFGSLELLRSGDGTGRELGHYLRIIDASARRINDYLTHGTSVVSGAEREGDDVNGD